MDAFLAVLEEQFYIIIFVVLISSLFASLMSTVAENKGHKGTTAFVLAFFFNILGMLYVIALPDLVARQQREAICNMLFVITEQQKNSDNSELSSKSLEMLDELTLNRE